MCDALARAEGQQGHAAAPKGAPAPRAGISAEDEGAEAPSQNKYEKGSSAKRLNCP